MTDPDDLNFTFGGLQLGEAVKEPKLTPSSMSTDHLHEPGYDSSDNTAASHGEVDIQLHYADEV